MSFSYNKFEMLEIFDSETIIDEEVKIARYEITNKENILFSLYLSPYDGDIVLSLQQKNLAIPILEISLEDIIQLKIDRKNQKSAKLIFYKNNNEQPIATAMIQPNISVSCDF